MNEIIAIVGSHSETRSCAPFDDPRVDIWVFNEAAGQQVKQDNGEFGPWAWRVNGVFQMHKPVIYRSPHNRSHSGHWDWLQEKHNFPIWMLEEDPDVPSGVKYPFDEINEELLSNFHQGRGMDIEQRPYFTSTIAYALALAIYKKQYKEIQLYGIEVTSDTEYVYQRDCITFWTGIALGRGLMVKFYGGTAMFDRPLYGYDGYVDQKPEDFLARAKELEETASQVRRARNQAEEELNLSWRNGNLSEKITEFTNKNYELGMIEGALKEVQKYEYKITDMWHDHGTAIIDRNEFEGAAGAAKPDIEKFSQDVHRTAGRIDYMMAVWTQSKNPASLSQLKGFIDQHVEAAYKSGMAQGIFEENYRLAKDIDARIVAAGGVKALEMLKEDLYG